MGYFTSDNSTGTQGNYRHNGSNSDVSYDGRIMGKSIDGGLSGGPPPRSDFFVYRLMKDNGEDLRKNTALIRSSDLLIELFISYPNILSPHYNPSPRNHKFIQRQVKTGVPQGGVLSPTLFNIHTSDIPTPTAPVQVMLYADDITITSTHTSMGAARKYIQP